MNGIIQTAKNKDVESLKLSQVTEMFTKFTKLSLERRKKVLDAFQREIENTENAEDKDFTIEVKSIFLDRHIKLSVAFVREKYSITGKPTEKDFYRICEGENITVVNSESAPEGKKIKVGCYFTSKDLPGESFLNFDERLVGDELLDQQFHLLGNHFLHQDKLPTAAKVFSELETLSEKRKEEAALFAIYFLDSKEVKE